jgi:hypothetical protein
MNKALITAPLTALLLSACVVSPSGRVHTGVGVGVTVPVLPAVVELGPEPNYSYGGYTYQYDNDRWRYAGSRGGPWIDLPRSHYPREIRYRRSQDRDRDGIPDRRDRDRDGDGVPNRRDSSPDDPRRN